MKGQNPPSKLAPVDCLSRRVAKAPATCISPEEAAALVKSGMWLDYGAILCQPDVFDKALAARAASLSNVKIRSCLSTKPRAFLESDPQGKHFHSFSWHFSGYDRAKHDAGRCTYVPINLGEVPDYYRRFIDPIDIVVLKTCPMDENGYFNFQCCQPLASSGCRAGESSHRRGEQRLALCPWA
jgi:acyl-CoA hydrolase